MSATPRDESGWTIETYSAYNEARRADQERFEAERDRRYSEVQAEREKALQIKETADASALLLARDIQAYKDEKANELREQISSERGLYVTQSDLKGAVEKIEATIAPILATLSTQQGRREGIGSSSGVFYAGLVLAVSIVSAVLLYIHHA